jgi:hypothetical protein
MKRHDTDRHIHVVSHFKGSMGTISAWLIVPLLEVVVHPPCSAES